MLTRSTSASIERAMPSAWASAGSTGPPAPATTSRIEGRCRQPRGRIDVGAGSTITGGVKWGSSPTIARTMGDWALSCSMSADMIITFWLEECLQRFRLSSPCPGDTAPGPPVHGRHPSSTIDMRSPLGRQRGPIEHDERPEHAVQLSHGIEDVHVRLMLPSGERRHMVDEDGGEVAGIEARARPAPRRLPLTMKWLAMREPHCGDPEQVALRG